MTSTELPDAYATARPDVTALVPADAHRVLDLGCAGGAVGADLRLRGHEVTGIEVNPAWAEVAGPRLDRVVQGDVEVIAAQRSSVGGPFDCILAADVLEHLRDPWMVLRWAAGLLTERGSAIVSLPNVRHLELVSRVLVGRRWPYDEEGIFDRTHLRWFTYRNVADLIANAGLQIVEQRRITTLVRHPRNRAHLWANNHLAHRVGDLGTVQFVVRAEPVVGGRR